PTDYPRPAVMRSQGTDVRRTLHPELTRGIQQFSRQQGVTVFMTVLAAFQVLLFRYSGQTDIVVGSPIANRTHRQTEDLIGFFVNTLALRAQLNGEQTFSELLTQVRQTALEAYSRQDIPFEYLVEQLNPVRRLSHSPVFQVMFVFQNAPQEALKLSGVTLSFLETEQTTAKFDLTLSVAEQDDVLVCDWEYNTDLFRLETIARMNDHFQVLLEGILKNSEQSLARLPLLTDAEQHQLLAWNQTHTEYPQDKTIVDLFQEQVENTPDNIAVVFEDQQLTYRQLNQKANQLAHYLLSFKNDSERCPPIADRCFVGICVERSLEMVIGVLGILKAGGAYVPLDPEYPQQRLQFMVEDSEIKVLLSQRHLLEQLPISTAKVICLENEWEQIAAASGENPVRQSGPEHLAYVMYTSGSTGRPKGVMVEHFSLYNQMQWRQSTFTFSAQDKILQKTPFSFDGSIWEFYSPLLAGGTLLMAKPGGHREPEYLLQTIQERRITALEVVPSLLKALVDSSDFHTEIPLRYLFCASEPLSHELKQHFYTYHHHTQLYNLYGPTEATVDATYWLCDKKNSPIAIGRPIANTRIYIVDVNHTPTPPGIPGELCIGGAGLARGYLNRPELTAEKFIDIELFGTTRRIYKTGDLARWLPDGTLEFLGRIDHQVNLRGFRIELSEIEVTLSRHDAVQEAVVVLYQQEDHPRLVAYVTLAMPVDDVAGVLRIWLKARLPDYMVPAAFMAVEKFPLTPNGKIDRRALSTLSVETQHVSSDDFVAPQTDGEKLLAAIWADVLGVERVGVHDNFFELGGHSLLATQLMSRIRNTFDIELSLHLLFESPTLAELMAHIETMIKMAQKTPVLAQDREEIEL
ncbi:MAG: amino acid adenylation domain-containing protein, partial [bacterium]|nr:amino acid adenylation domain-containing protein [bacterium]